MCCVVYYYPAGNSKKFGETHITRYRQAFHKTQLDCRHLPEATEADASIGRHKSMTAIMKSFTTLAVLLLGLVVSAEVSYSLLLRIVERAKSFNCSNKLFHTLSRHCRFAAKCYKRHYNRTRRKLLSQQLFTASDTNEMFSRSPVARNSLARDRIRYCLLLNAALSFTAPLAIRLTVILAVRILRTIRRETSARLEKMTMVTTFTAPAMKRSISPLAREDPLSVTIA